MVATNIKIETIRDVVIRGLSKTPKQLPSWLFYDEKGDKIFQQIMRLPEYYLTRSELEILQRYKSRFAEHFSSDDSPFDLVELGAGDGTKTEILLAHLSQTEIPFTYVPVDVSLHVLTLLQNRLKKNLPDVEVEIVNASIEKMHEFLSEQSRKVFLYLGANIGNLEFPNAQRFVSGLAASMNERDLLVIGFDLKKDPRLILSAYNDASGVTRDFNLNLLTRLNRELGGDFQLDNFDHYPLYDPETGITKSFLVSNTDQEVFFRSIGKTFPLRKWETIHTEVSLKYDVGMIETLAQKSNLEIVDIYYDKERNFCDAILKKE